MCPRDKQLENATTHSDKAVKIMLVLTCFSFHFLASQMQKQLLLCYYIPEDFPHPANK